MVITHKSNYIGEHTDINVVREKLKRAKDGDKSLDRENRKRAGEMVMANNNKKGFMNIQLFGEDPQGATTPQTTETQTQIDYESEYKKMLAERDSFKAEAEKQKKLKDEYASENAGYKKKEIEKMSDDERKAKEYQDLVDSANQMKEELAKMKLEKEFLANGFTAEETTKLIESSSSPKTIAEIIKAKVELAIKSAKAEAIKEGTTQQPMGNGTSSEGGKSRFQMFQESQKQKTNRVEI